MRVLASAGDPIAVGFGIAIGIAIGIEGGVRGGGSIAIATPTATPSGITHVTFGGPRTSFW